MMLCDEEVASSRTEKMAPTNNSTEDAEEEDVGALIYRESQLRKAETTAVKRKSAA